MSAMAYRAAGCFFFGAWLFAAVGSMWGLLFPFFAVHLLCLGIADILTAIDRSREP